MPNCSMLTTTVLILLSVLLGAGAADMPNCTSITATDTDRAMSWFCQGNGVRRCTNQHIACQPPGSAVPKGVVLFLPGTYLQPSDYSDIVAEFASYGYLSLGLFYPSAEGQNGCGASRAATPTDLNCTARERFKVLTGSPNGGYTNITFADSIVNRAAKALKYLGVPWSDYLDASTQAVRWSDVIVAGHSNGADHAAFLAKNFNVSRALMLAGPNDNVGVRGADRYYKPAPWVYSNWTSNVTDETSTPAERMYSFGVCGFNNPPPPSPLTTSWEVFEGFTNIYDREPSPTNTTHGTIKFVGIFNSSTECFAAVNATNGTEGPFHSFTYNDASVKQPYTNHCWGDTSMSWQGIGNAAGQTSGRGPGFPSVPPPVQHPSDDECWHWRPGLEAMLGAAAPWYKQDDIEALAHTTTFAGMHRVCSSGLVPHGSSGDGYNHMASAANCCMPRFAANATNGLAGRILWTKIFEAMLANPTGTPPPPAGNTSCACVA